MTLTYSELFPTTLTGAIGSQSGIRMEKGATVLDLLNPVASSDDFPDLGDVVVDADVR